MHFFGIGYIRKEVISMLRQEYNFDMPFGEYAYPYGANVSFSQSCPFCGSPLGTPYGWGGPGMVDPFGGMYGPGMSDPFGGMFGPGMGGQCPYGGNPWWR